MHARTQPRTHARTQPRTHATTVPEFVTVRRMQRKTGQCAHRRAEASTHTRTHNQTHNHIHNHTHKHKHKHKNKHTQKQKYKHTTQTQEAPPPNCTRQAWSKTGVSETSCNMKKSPRRFGVHCESATGLVCKLMSAVLPSNKRCRITFDELHRALIRPHPEHSPLDAGSGHAPHPATPRTPKPPSRNLARDLAET
jgi:hypothetical protein